jgi:hypothetical protein
MFAATEVFWFVLVRVTSWIVLVFWTNGTIHEATRTKHETRLPPKSTFEAKLWHAVYRTTYVDNQEYYKLVFERNPLDDHRRNEYKVSKFDFEFREDVTASNVSVDLAPASKEQLKMINSLARDGFVVRDLFIAGGYNILLERTPAIQPR